MTGDAFIQRRGGAAAPMPGRPTPPPLNPGFDPLTQNPGWNGTTYIQPTSNEDKRSQQNDQTHAFDFQHQQETQQQQRRAADTADELAQLSIRQGQMRNNLTAQEMGGTSYNQQQLQSFLGDAGHAPQGGGGWGGGSGSFTPIAPPSGGGDVPPVSNVAHVDTGAAQSAAFARAKDQVGQESSSALAGLHAALAGRGLLGSGAESRGTQGVVMQGQQQLGETSRSQAEQRASQAQTEALANQSAEVTQRGQNITQRGQTLAAQQAANQLQMQQAQLAAQQRASSLAGLSSALRATSGSLY